MHCSSFLPSGGRGKSHRFHPSSQRYSGGRRLDSTSLLHAMLRSSAVTNQPPKFNNLLLAPTRLSAAHGKDVPALLHESQPLRAGSLSLQRPFSPTLYIGNC